MSALRGGAVPTWGAAGVGAAALALVMGPVPDQDWWVGSVGAIGVLSVFAERLRWMAGLLPVSVLLMGVATRSAPTAALVGMLVMSYAFLVDEAEVGDADVDRWLGLVLPSVVLGSVAAVVTVVAVLELPPRGWLVVVGPLAALVAFALVRPRNPASAGDA